MYTQGGYQNLLGNNRILVSNAAGPAQCGVEFVCKETHPKKTHSTIARVAYPQRVVREVGVLGDHRRHDREQHRKRKQRPAAGEGIECPGGQRGQA